MLEDFPEGATEPEWTNQDERSEYQRQTVFLQTPVCRFTPHTLHCIEIAPGCVLLVICEVTLYITLLGPDGQLQAWS